MSAFMGLALSVAMSARASASPDPVALRQVPGMERPSGNIDLVALEEKISNTSAMTIFAKLELKSGIDSLTSEVGQIRSGQSNTSLTELKKRFEEFLYSTVAKLREGDPALADELAMSRDELWRVLTNPENSASATDN